MAGDLHPDSAGDRNLTRVLRLLEADQARVLTIAALRERGIEAPALTVYELQLAGYNIERVCLELPEGRTMFGYRLRDELAPGPDPLPQVEGALEG
jgi:hypothetical protein